MVYKGRSGLIPLEEFKDAPVIPYELKVSGIGLHRPEPPHSIGGDVLVMLCAAWSRVFGWVWGLGLRI